jgi:AraC-like DNA-binding protein
MSALSRAEIAALGQARKSIEQGFARHIVIAELADAAGMSKFRFIRSFADVYGETPGSYLTRRRVEYAQILLTATRLPIREIARAVGYRSHGTFSTRFRAFSGVSPSEYRKRRPGVK